MRYVRPHRLWFVFVAALAALVLYGGVALAAHPHFTAASASGPDAAGALSVTFQETGLGNAGEIHNEASAASVTATYAQLSVTDTTNNVTIVIPGTFSRTII